MIKKVVWNLFILIALVRAGDINVAVAANVSYAIKELKSSFIKAYPGIDVHITLGSSGKLTAQIRHGAPYGIFMSADMDYPQRLYLYNLASTKPKVYAEGTLSLFSIKSLDFSKGIAFVEDADIQRIAIANPKTAPYGKATLEVLKNYGLLSQVKKKLIYAESISQAVTYTMTAVDLGFIATASLFSPKMRQYKEYKHWMRVNPSLYRRIKQGIVLLKKGENSAEYQAFYDFMLSDVAKRILARYGYVVS